MELSSREPGTCWYSHRECPTEHQVSVPVLWNCWEGWQERCWVAGTDRMDLLNLNELAAGRLKQAGECVSLIYRYTCGDKAGKHILRYFILYSIFLICLQWFTNAEQEVICLVWNLSMGIPSWFSAREEALVGMESSSTDSSILA